MGASPNPLALGTPPPPPGIAGQGQSLQGPTPGAGPQLRPADLAKALIQRVFDVFGLLSKILVQAAPNALPMIEAATNNLGQVMSELSGGPQEREGATAPPPATPAQPPTGMATSAAPPAGYQPGM